ncbi:hypothetical protein [Plebeiibacterium sediminum]|uniref:Uncharacterized protein n=1 Tax=Plebeiibacterium sediminum TaxID=2992112 RepID=A0AAE3M332_9BACT|nr:hypothetical protein [Plebeiobacterium sediminum]MCW3786081.1 hypothetical protein [Plebeiobacterium sediminum]
MKKSNLIKLILLFAILLSHLSSCEYEPEGDNFEQIDLDAFNLKLLLESPLLSEKYISAWNDVNIYYRFTSHKYAIDEVQFFLNDEEIFHPHEEGWGDNITIYERYSSNDSWYTCEDTLEIPMEFLEEGNNKLIAKVTGVSGSGSIADVRNRETSIEEYKWIIVAHKNHHKPYSFSVEDHKLHLEWSEYNHKFNHYIVEKYCGEILMDTFTSEENLIVDESYVGERAVYKVFVVLGDGTKNELFSIDKENELPELKLCGNNHNAQFIYWHPFTKYDALKEISIRCYDNKGNVNFKGIAGINDTIIKVTGDKYGAINKVTMTLFPKDNDLLDREIKEKFRRETYLKMGSRTTHEIFQYNGIVPLQSNLFLLRDSNQMLVYSPLDEEMVDISYASGAEYQPKEYIILKFSPEGDRFVLASGESNKYHLYIKDEQGYGYHHILKDRDEDLIRCYTFDAIYKDLIFLRTGEYGDVIYDMQQRKIVGNYNPYGRDDVFLSMDGNYIIYRGDYDRIGSIKNGVYKQLYKSPYRILFEKFEFHKMYPDYVVCVESGRVTIRNIKDFSVKNSYSISGEKVLSLDTEFNQLLTIEGERSIVRNIMTGEIMKEFDFAYKDSKLYGNTFYDNSGLFYYIYE